METKAKSEEVKEKQKEYNKQYYANNKAKIESKIGLKEKCLYCGREVRHQNMMSHCKTQYCITRRKLQAQIEKERAQI